MTLAAKLQLIFSCARVCAFVEQPCRASASLPLLQQVPVAYPLAVSTIIGAGTAPSSPFQRTSKIVHDHTGIVCTFRWNLRSRCAGNRDHEEPTRGHLRG